MEDFGKTTVNELIKRLAALHQEANAIKARYAELDSQAAAIRALLPPEVIEKGIANLLEETKATGLGQTTVTLRERIIAFMTELNRPARPSEIVSKLLTGLDNRKQLSAKVNTELRRMLNRDNPVIEKKPKARYQLTAKEPPESSGSS